MYNYQLLIRHILESGVRFRPNQKIIYRGIKEFTYLEFYKRVHKLANFLTKIGAKKGTRIAVFDWDSHRYLECYFAIPMMGAVLHTVNVRLSPEQILYTIKHAKDDIILFHKDFLPLIKKLKPELSFIKKFVILTDDGNYENDITDIEYESSLEKEDDKFNFEDFDENTMATLSYTTGTTGDPKGVWFTHRKLVLHTLSATISLTGYNSPCKLTPDDVYMPLTPMFHVHAWGMPYIATLLGFPQIYVGRYEPNLIIDLVKKYNVTFSHCVPTILNMILEAAKDTVFNNWKMIIGGAKLTKGLCEKGYAKGIKLMTGYGMSETCPILTLSLMRDELLDLPESEKIDYYTKTGFPIPLVYLRNVDENFEDVATNEKDMGELVVRAPWLTDGYLNNKEASEKLWENGWLHTGDIAVKDKYGYFTIVDRAKDVIKSGGEWVSSLTLENLLSQHEKVKEVAVIGIPDSKWDERPLAIIVTTNGEKIPESELKEHLMKFVDQEKISKYAIPEKFVFVEELPKTSVGKLDKKVMRKQFS